jgi:hypothetical protein
MINIGPLHVTRSKLDFNQTTSVSSTWMVYKLMDNGQTSMAGVQGPNRHLGNWNKDT